MSNPYYSNTGYPQFRAPGKSEDMRAELKRVEGGMDRLPDPIMPNQPVFGNASGTGMVMKGKDAAKELLDLDKVDNTSDADKPISAATAAALETKADKDEIAANLPNVTTAGADKIVVTNSSGDGWDYIAAIVDPERPVRLGDTSLRENVKVTVGAGGDFPTINAAVLHLSRFTPDLGVTAEVELQSGFVMSEQLFVEGLDLGWITITGVDAETVINEPSLTRVLINDHKPAFGVTNGTLPTIGQLFVFSSKGSADDIRSGVIANEVGRANILPGCGVKNAGLFGIHAIGGSTINADGANASGAGSDGIYATGGSTINAVGANASGAGQFSIVASAGSTINADGANASGAGNVGIYANTGSTINAQGANATGAGTYGIYANAGSTINALGASATGAGTYGIAIINGATINAIIATGTLSQAKNTVTANGIIFQS